MRIALLSNVTVEVLAGMLGKEHDLWLAPGFGAWMETALAVPESLKAFAPEAVFLLLDASHGPCDPAAAEAAVSALERALPRTTVFVPDLEDLAREQGAFYDERMWQAGAMPWSLGGLRALCGEIDRLLRLLKGGRRKVLALDFDGTLWKGVLGEDGVSGIEPFVELQREVRALRERGVLLVGLSKSDAADVERVWDDPRMVLQRGDFVDLRLDWNDKADNLEASARMLNLGTDSFVFVDDDPVERAHMAARHPEVAVPDGAVPMRRIARLWFPRMRLTDEDRAKTGMYRAEANRRALGATLSLGEYLKELDIRTEIHAVTADEYARVAQLSQKANQFNVRTNRYTADDIARFASDPERLLASVRVSDRFGDQGLVAFVHVAGCEIVDFVMSCRTMNRRIEFAVCDWLAEALRGRGAAEMRATWRRTAKNAPVRDLFDRLGFARLHSTEEERTYAKVLG